MSVKESFVEKLQRQSKKRLQKLKEEKKRDKENNRILQIFCLWSLGFQKEVRHFCLMFILLPLKDLFHYLNLRNQLKQFKKMTKITKKL
jgi:hypothetical protein